MPLNQQIDFQAFRAGNAEAPGPRHQPQPSAPQPQTLPLRDGGGLLSRSCPWRTCTTRPGVFDSAHHGDVNFTSAHAALEGRHMLLTQQGQAAPVRGLGATRPGRGPAWATPGPLALLGTLLPWPCSPRAPGRRRIPRGPPLHGSPGKPAGPVVPTGLTSREQLPPHRLGLPAGEGWGHGMSPSAPHPRGPATGVAL